MITALNDKVSLGPNRSVNRPVIIENKPRIKKEIDVAPEIVALPQPNSSWSGLKKMPKLELMPCMTTRIRAEVATMI